MQRLPRLVQKDHYFIFAGGAVMMLLMAGCSLWDLSFATTPPWAIALCVVFLSVWLGVIGWFASFGIVALQSVEIDRDEIRVCLGPVVLRRIPIEAIRTVGIGVMQNKDRHSHGYSTEVFLVLSRYAADELNEKGRRFLHSLRTERLSQDAPVTPKGPYAAAKAYLLRYIFRNLLWVHYTSEMEAALRKRLNTALFLFPERQDDI